MIGALVGLGILRWTRSLRRAAAQRKWLRKNAGACVVITGGARGLGLALARRYVDRGCSVAICSRHEDDLRTAAAELNSRSFGVEVLTRLCDVGEAEQVEQFIREVHDACGTISLLINCAGVIEVGPVQGMSLADFRESAHSNFWGVVNTCRAVTPYMIEQGDGQIVNITSIGGVVPVPHLVPYAAAKFGAVGFSTSLGTELRKHGVRVSTVVPGLMRTGSFVQARFKGDAAQEFSWFAFAGNSPLTAIGAERAAEAIVEAADRAVAFQVIGWMAKAQRLFFALFPNFTLHLLSMADRVLPRLPADFDPMELSERGLDLRENLPARPYTYLGNRAVEVYNESR